MNRPAVSAFWWPRFDRIARWFVDTERERRGALLALHAEGKMARNWPLRFLIRHTAFHALDHAWEMEDKDLTVRAA